MASHIASPRTQIDTVAVGVIAPVGESRTRIARALVGYPDLDVTYGASSNEFGRPVRGLAVLIVLCQAMNPDELSALAFLKRALPETYLVVVSESAEGMSVRRAIRTGVDGIVLANRVEASLLATIWSVIEGQLVVPRQARCSVGKPALSVREKQILGMVVMGFTNGQIGAQLFLAESTVKSHLTSAFSKLGVRSRNEATALILDREESLGTGILGITEAPRPAPDRA